MQRAVLSVLADLYSKSVSVSQHPQKETEKKHILSVPDVTLKLCRIVLRRTASLVDDEACCRLFKRNLMDVATDGAHRLINSRGMAFDYLDFRTIDCKLAVGAYEGSHEAFLRDVQEVDLLLACENFCLHDVQDSCTVFTKYCSLTFSSFLLYVFFI